MVQFRRHACLVNIAQHETQASCKACNLQGMVQFRRQACFVNIEQDEQKQACKAWCNSKQLLYKEIVVSSFFKTLLPCVRDVTLSLNERTDWQTYLHVVATFVTHTLWPSSFSNIGKKGRRHVTDYARDNCNSKYVFRWFSKHSNIDVFQILMVVAYQLLIFRRKFLMVVAYF